MSKNAIVSVYDKTGLEPFVQGLVRAGFQIFSTGGTAKFLSEKGITVRSIDQYTGHPEILEGRVKSLHPRIHGGILARKDRADDLAQLQQHSIEAFDVVVVNLYPFTKSVEEVVQQGKSPHASLVEMIDIGGPTMIRAAAKNCAHVVPISDPADYSRILEELVAPAGVTPETRRHLAAKVFRMMSEYDAAISRYFSLGEQLLTDAGQEKKLAPIEGVVLERVSELRYGENPHQHAALYRRFSSGLKPHPCLWTQLQGKEISYNNLLDLYAALDLFIEVWRDLGEQHAAVIIKHSNPCGVAIRATALEAFRAARDCDPVSAFGGIIAVSGTLDRQLAETILEGFVEVLLVSELTAEAKEVLAKKKNVRVLRCDFSGYAHQLAVPSVSVRNFGDEYLVQTTDHVLSSVAEAQIVSAKKPTAEMMKDFALAWKLCKHVKSNVIVVVKDQQAIGIGAGQMSRVDSAKISLDRARQHGFHVQGAVAASDAFLPFPDTLEILNDGGVVGLIQPGGSIKDEAVIASANDRGVVMLLTGERHFRH